MDSPRWAEEIEQLARSTFAAAARALAEFGRQVEAGKATNAKSAAIAQGVLIDQVEKLRRIAAEMGEQEVRLAEAQAQQLADIIRRFLEDIGLSLGPPGGAVTAVLRHHLTSAGGGESLSPAPHAEAARREVRAASLAAASAEELLGHASQLGPGDEQRALPARARATHEPRKDERSRPT